MVDHNVQTIRLQGPQQRRGVRDMAVQLQMPALFTNAFQQGSPFGARQVWEALAHEVQTHAPDPKPIHFLHRLALDVPVKHHHPAQLPRRGLQGAEQVAVVGAQETGLHQYAMAETMGQQLAQVVAQRRIVAGRVTPLAGQVQPTAEHVGMAVDGGEV